MTAEVITMPTPLDPLVQRIRNAYERTERGRQDWIEGTLELAQALAEARGRFPADRQLSIWLAKNDVDLLGKDDRAALVEMGRNTPMLRAVLVEQTEVLHPITLWRKHGDRFRQLSKPELPPKNAEISTPTPLPTEKPFRKDDDSSVHLPISGRSPFRGLPRADTVHAIYTTAKARSTIGKALRQRGGKDLWQMILSAIDGGLLRPTDAQFSGCTLRVLFPGAPVAYCKRFDLTNADDRKRVREQIVPAAIANREAVIAAPERLEEIVAEHWRRQQETARAEATRRKIDDALATMPEDQREIVMFGVRLWPRVDAQFGDYDYDQVCAAIWYFRDFDGWVLSGRSGNSPQSRAIIVRLSTRWFSEYFDRAYPDEHRSKMKKVFSLVHTVARLFENNPDGVCIVPPTPKTGHW